MVRDKLCLGPVYSAAYGAGGGGGGGEERGREGRKRKGGEQSGRGEEGPLHYREREEG